MMRNAVIVTPQQDQLGLYITEFLRYMGNVVAQRWTLEAEGYSDDPMQPSSSFSVFINRHGYQAQIVDLTSRDAEAANLAICFAISPSEGSVFFCLEKDQHHNWSPRQSVLPMSWEEFSQLSKAEQFAALGC